MGKKLELVFSKIIEFYIEYSKWVFIVSAFCISLISYLLHKIYSDFVTSIFIFVILLIMGFIRYKIINNIYEKAHTDALTGVRNRMYFYYKMPMYLKKIGKNKTFLFAMLDIDHFKQVNDKDGHNAGDILIREVATLLRNNLDKDAEVIRYGGDEFCMILPNTSLQDGYMLFEKIRLLVYEKYNNNYNENYIYKYNYKYNYYITISIGLVEINKYITIHKLVETADKCLYKAKENRNKIVVLDEDEDYEKDK